MLRKLAASFFLTVMALVIGLHSPVLGYCAAEDEVFLVTHEVVDHGHHDCDHGPEPLEVPCEEEHEFLTLDAGDFQWSPLVSVVPPLALVAEDFEVELRVSVVEKFVFIPRVNLVDPPPPELLIFRRDAALRI